MLTNRTFNRLRQIYKSKQRVKTFLLACTAFFSKMPWYMPDSHYPFRNLAFEGGGVLGIAYAGALQVLEEEGILDGIERVAGTSVGAITSLAVALRYSALDLETLLKNLNFEDFLSEAEPVKLPKYYGWYNTSPIADWLTELIAKAGANLPEKPKLRGDESFHELAKHGMRELRVFATNLNLRSTTTFSPTETPEISVRDAVLASIAIPLFFQAFQFPKGAMQGHIFVDGGLIFNYPLTAFDEESPNPETLGFRFERRQKNASTDLEFGQIRGWAQNMFEIIKNMQAEAIRFLPKGPERTVPIPVDAVRVIDFDLSARDRDWLMESGRLATQFYLQRFRNQSRLSYRLLRSLHLRA